MPVVEPPDKEKQPVTPEHECRERLSYYGVMTGLILINLVAIWNDCFPENYPHNREQLSTRKALEEIYHYVLLYNLPLLNICSFRDKLFLSFYRAIFFTGNVWVLLLLHSQPAFNILQNSPVLTETIITVIAILLLSPSALLYKLVVKTTKKPNIISDNSQYKSEFIDRETRIAGVICLVGYGVFWWMVGLYFILLSKCSFIASIHWFELCICGIFLLIFFVIKLWL